MQKLEAVLMELNQLVTPPTRALVSSLNELIDWEIKEKSNNAR